MLLRFRYIPYKYIFVSFCILTKDKRDISISLSLVYENYENNRYLSHSQVRDFLPFIRVLVYHWFGMTRNLLNNLKNIYSKFYSKIRNSLMVVRKCRFGTVPCLNDAIYLSFFHIYLLSCSFF